MLKPVTWSNPAYERPAAQPGKAPVYLLVAAAGSGSRMGLDQNKQFASLGGLPVIVRTLKALQEVPAITGLVLIAAAEELDQMRDLLQPFAFPGCWPSRVAVLASRHL